MRASEAARNPARSSAVSRSGDRDLMTVGELAHRTGMSRKAIRDLEDRGLIYSAGRSEANYRLFDGSALWCVRVIGNLRSLGLTLKEIEHLAGIYLERPGEPVGPHLAALLDRAENRIEDQLTSLQALQGRIRRFRRENAASLAGTGEADLAPEDPRRSRKRA